MEEHKAATAIHQRPRRSETNCKCDEAWKQHPATRFADRLRPLLFFYFLNPMTRLFEVSPSCFVIQTALAEFVTDESVFGRDALAVLTRCNLM